MTKLMSAAEAAAQIHALINSQSRSPLPSEIEAILADTAVYVNLTGTLTQVQCDGCLAPQSDVAKQIRELIPRVQEARAAAGRADTTAITEGRDPDECPVWQAADAVANKLSEELKALRKTAWIRALLHPELDGLFVLAECAQHHLCDWPNSPQALTAEGIFGKLVMAVLNYGGFSYSVHGEAWDADDKDIERETDDEWENP